MTREEFRKGVRILENAVDSANRETKLFDFALNYTTRKEFDSMSFSITDFEGEGDFLYYEYCTTSYSSSDIERTFESCFRAIESFKAEDKQYKGVI